MRQRNREQPWEKSLRAAKARCQNPNHNRYQWYGGRGIKISLTLPEIKFLWDRDGGSQMKSPTLDRINPDGDYFLANCRFIERAENSSRACPVAQSAVVECLVCGKDVVRLVHVIVSEWNKGKRRIFCGKACAGRHNNSIRRPSCSPKKEP